MTRRIGFLVSLSCLCGCLFAEKLAEFPDLFHPVGIVLDDHYIYISQDINVFIYAAKDYKFIKKFGTKGEGPGEFMYLPYVYIRPDHIVASTNNKILFFSKTGEFIRERKTRPAGTWLVPFKDKFAARRYLQGKNNLRYHAVMLLDGQLNRIKDIYRHIHGFQSIEVEFNPMTIAPPEFTACDDFLLMRDGARTKVIVFNRRGEKLFELKDPGKRVRFTDEDKKEFIRLSKSYDRLKNVIIFPADHPPIRWFYADPVGRRIYLETERTQKDKRNWIVYNFKGQFVKTIMLPILSKEYTSWNFELLNAFYDGKCYQLKETDEVWELHATDVDSL